MSLTFPVESIGVLAFAGLRLMALFIAAPALSHKAVPIRVRVGLAVAITIAFSPAIFADAQPLPTSTLALAATGLREVLIGVTLGFVARLAFAGFGLLGEFMSVQGGLGAANVLDPASGASAVVLSSLLQLFALALFLAVDGHHVLFRAVFHSFASLPVAGAALATDRLAEVTRFGGVVWEIGARLAAPVTALMLVSNVAVGILGRLIPQLNLMALQLPAHIGLTLMVIGLGAGPLIGAMVKVLERVNDEAALLVTGAG